MKNRHLKTIGQLLWVVIATSLLYACANMASPNGGPYDELPPKFVSSTPAPGQLNYKGKKVEILFDELIQVDKPTDHYASPGHAAGDTGKRPTDSRGVRGYVA